MNPIYNEYIKFLDDNCSGLKEEIKEKYNIDLKEGYFWLDNQVIKFFNDRGEIKKLCRLKIEDDLSSIGYKLYKNNKIKNIEIISWEKLYEISKDRLDTIEKESLNLIKENINIYNEYTPLILSSTGKDSNVVTYLVRKVNNSAFIVHNNTSLDCADSYKMMKETSNSIIMSPAEGFYQWRERNNFVPTRFARACCSIFKEGVFSKEWDRNKNTLIFMGMRNQESPTRNGYGDYWKNESWPNKWQGVLPIRKWTEMDVWLYTIGNNIPINSKYKKGYSRVGCAIACPFYTKSTWILDKYWYPEMYERWHKILDNDFVKNNKDIVLNCSQCEYHTCWNGGKVRDEPTEETVSRFAERNGLSEEIAKKYFNHSCSECGKNIKTKEVYGMNMKFYGRCIEKFRCKKCLMKDLGLTTEEWDKKVKDFKNDGCKLF